MKPCQRGGDVFAEYKVCSKDKTKQKGPTQLLLCSESSADSLEDGRKGKEAMGGRVKMRTGTGRPQELATL